MAKLKLVTRRTTDNGYVFDFRCPYPSGCGMNGEPFSSIGWATHELAANRGKQHVEEHQTGTPMPTLHDFRVEQGVTEESAGEAVKPDDWEF